jgi:uncharacterized membrane protein
MKVKIIGFLLIILSVQLSFAQDSAAEQKAPVVSTLSGMLRSAGWRISLAAAATCNPMGGST